MKIIEVDDKARLKIYNGINFAGNRVRSTYGPAGLNTLLGFKFLKPLITNDGLRTIKGIELEDELENTAVRVMEGGMQAVNDLAGGARTATAILIQEIFDAGYARFSNDPSVIKKVVDPQKIKKEIDEACKAVVLALKNARQIETLEDIEKVAFISVENKELAHTIAEVVHTVGKDGYIKVEESDALGIQTYISEGLEIKSGFISADMATNERKESIVEDAHILVTAEKITNQEQLATIAEYLNNKEIKDLVVFAPEFDHAVIKAFNIDRVRNIFRILAVKMSTWDKGLPEDICTVSGATFSQGIEHIPQLLGKVEKVIADQEKTVLIGGVKDKTISINLLKNELKKTKSPFDKQKIEERIARISGKVALIEVGAMTEIDRARLKDKVEDGVHDTQGSLEEGVLPGAGVALKNISESLPENILTNALKACYLQIQKNTGGLEISDDVIDSAKSLRIAVQSACNIAGNLLTVGTISAEKNETNTE